MNKFYESRDAYKDILVNGFNYLNSLPTTWLKPILAGITTVVLEAMDKAASDYLHCYDAYVKELRKNGDTLSAEDARLHNIILDKISYCEDLYFQLVEKYDKE